MSTLGIIGLIIAVLLVLAIVGVAVWWLRTQSGAAIRSFFTWRCGTWSRSRAPRTDTRFHGC